MSLPPSPPKEHEAEKDSDVEALLKGVCRLHLHGRCIKDFKCPKTHVQDAAMREKLLARQKTHRKPVARPAPASVTAAADDAARLEALREHEMQQLRIRYHENISTEQHAEGGGMTLVVNHEVTDPDFPYDLPSLLLQIDIPAAYPAAASPAFCVLNSELPSTVKQNIEAYAKTTAADFRGDCCIKQVLTAIDANLETLMVVRKASAVKIVAFTQQSSGDSPPNQRQTASFNADSRQNDADAESAGSTLHAVSNPPARLFPAAMPANFSQQATRVLPQFRAWNNVSLLLLVSADLLLQCARCAAQNVFVGVAAGTVHRANCSRCDRLLVVELHAEFLHQKAPILAFIQPKGGCVLAVVRCDVQLECEHCDDALFDGRLLNVLRIGSVAAGDRISAACRNCRAKMCVSFDAFLLQAAAADGASVPKVKQQKIPGLVVGQPLPDRGTCKHYRKSFRWLRFPCCGKIFACDVCHDAQNADGHATCWATRQICGFCSREQPTSNAKCACGASFTDDRTTAHWEGGRGSRNVVTMSRKDSHKYRNMTKAPKDAASSSAKPKAKPK